MGTRYICDACGKEYDVKGGTSPNGYPYVGQIPVPDKWVVISYLPPKELEPQPKPRQGLVGIPPGRIPKGFLVCSQACAEKVLDEAKEHLRKAFEKAT